jgi:hypothetical protein
MQFSGDTSHYSLSYRDLRDHHSRLCSLPDEEFLVSLPNALHLACVISYLKELDSEATVGDAGIVHELVHLLAVPQDSDLSEIRRQFREVLTLA